MSKKSDELQINGDDLSSKATTALLRAFSSNLEEVEENRKGTITPRQRTLLDEHIRIGGCGTRAAIFAFIGSGAFLVALPYLMGESEEAAPAMPWIIGTALLLIGIGGIFIAIGKRRLNRLRNPEIRVAEGRVEKRIKEIGRARWKAFHARIGSEQFQLTTEQQYEAFVDGASYRVFYIHYPPTHIILSAESVDGSV